MAGINISPNQPNWGNLINQSLGNKNMTGVSSLANLLSDYSSIKSGSYGKLMKAYYGKDATTSSSKSTGKSETEETDKTEKTTSSSVTQATAERRAAKYGSSSSELVKTTVDKDTTDSATELVEAITTAKKADYSDAKRENALTKVQEFVDSYNTLIKNGSDSSLDEVTRLTEDVADRTKVYEKTLAKAGITIGKDGKLSLDADTFKNASESTLTGLFKKSGSFAEQVSEKALSIYRQAASGGNAQSGYTESGTYSATAAGTMWDSIT